MKKRKYIIRFYKVHDRDLVTLIEKYQVNIIKAVYCALAAFCNGDVFAIEIPKHKIYGSINNTKKVYSKMLYLDEDKDRKAVELLSKIKNGSKNNFLKNILRLYLCYPLTTDFLKDENDIAEFDDMFFVFRKGRRVADAASYNKKERRNRYSVKNTRNRIEEKSGISIKENNGNPAIKTAKEHTSVYMKEAVGGDVVKDHDEIVTKGSDDNMPEDNSENLLDLFTSLM